MSEEEIPRRMRRFYRMKEGKPSGEPLHEEAQEKKESLKKEARVKPTKEVEQWFRDIGKKEEEELVETLYEEEKVSEPKEAEGSALEKRRGKPEKEAAEELYRASKEVGIEERAKEASAELAISKVRGFRERHKRLPTEKESEKLSDTVYEEVKSQFPAEAPEESKRHARERTRGAKKEIGKEEFALPQTEKKKLSISELFGIESEEHPELIEQMSEEPESEKEEKQKEINLEEELKKIAKGEAEGVTREIETEKNVCPNCNNKSSEIVFCPNCDAGFCAHCAKSVKPYDNIVVYKCPKCSKEFKVQAR